MSRLLDVLKKTNWLKTVITVAGVEIPVVFRKLTPGDYFELGGIFASLVEGKQPKQPSAEDLMKQTEAAQKILHVGCVKEVGSSEPAFELDEIKQIPIDDLIREFNRLLEFSGIGEEEKKKARRFRKES